MFVVTFAIFSVQLSQTLKENGVQTCGTVRNQRGEPEEMKLAIKGPKAQQKVNNNYEGGGLSV